MTFLRKLLVASALAWPFIANGADIRPYSDEAFAALQATETPTLVDVYADWCPTCRRQEQILDNLLSEPELSDLVVLKLDWDAQRETARAFGAPRQSTFIVFRGDEERGRSVADTRPESIRELLQTAVAN
jgi:thioredoxin 1